VYTSFIKYVWSLGLEFGTQRVLVHVAGELHDKSIYMIPDNLPIVMMWEFL